ncbi:MAG: rhomboid family intramembrane serine protease [Herpetosiphonaceae bacterium]|nr:rhomboid family intramembrane serine protease [Herpetosiphonaceae bacterium]
MFPIGDQNRPGHLVPVVNYLLIAANVAVFLLELQLGSTEAMDAFITRYGAVPTEIIARQHLSTLFTSLFVHAGWAHIFGNMVFLLIFGDNVEDALGHAGYLIFYLVVGLLASLTFVALNAGLDTPSVGASGAISGVLGAYLIFFGNNRIRVLIFFFIMTVPAWVMIGLWAGQQFFATYGALAQTAQTEMSGVAYAAHAGGFLAGLLIAAVLRVMLGRPEQRPASRTGRYA